MAGTWQGRGGGSRKAGAFVGSASIAHHGSAIRHGMFEVAISRSKSRLLRVVGFLRPDARVTSPSEGLRPGLWHQHGGMAPVEAIGG
jgi:hypothetical protein